MQGYFFGGNMNGLIEFKNKIYILESASVVGKMESEGPLGGLFDFEDISNLFGKKTWEEAESETQRLAYNTLLSKLGFSVGDFDFAVSGDLMNQCVAGSYSFSNLPLSYLGIYGACSTFALGLAVGGMLITLRTNSRVATLTSSHYCSAERQFRTPLEYGSQRTPTAQWTVTGAAAIALSGRREGSDIYICDAYIGKVIDKGINDPNNMGAAMAPAALDTLISYFKETNTSPSDYDKIYTGDLGKEGSDILRDLMAVEGYKLGENYDDCGCRIYDREKQDVHSGGSGCACSACVFAAEIHRLMRAGELENVLIIGTGALMSPQFLMQGKTIPSVAHLVHIVKEKKESEHA